MAFDRVIKGGTIYTASATFATDIGISGEKVAYIGRIARPEGAEVIDARGKFIIPGAIDVHVHFQLPLKGTVSCDDFETGTRAAACGGVTTVIDFAMQGPNDMLRPGIEARMQEAQGKVCVDYSLHGSINDWKRIKNPARALRDTLDMGVPTYKMFMIYAKEGWQSDDSDIFAAMVESEKCGGMILMHAESEKVMNWLIGRYWPHRQRFGALAHALSRPNFIEEEAVHRACKWAQATGSALYIVHTSTGGAADCVDRFHKLGVNVFAETCPQYLFFTDDLFRDRRRGHWYATAPQLKKKQDNERLWQAIQHGELCVVGTDNCSFNTFQKDIWQGDFTKIPLGLPVIQMMFPSLYTCGVRTQKFSLNHLVSLVSTNPARVMGMFPRKGAIAVGSDADIVVFDPCREFHVTAKSLAHNCDWTPFEGWRVWGMPDFTLCRGAVVVRSGRFTGRKGYGKFIRRYPHGWRQLTQPWSVRSAQTKFWLPA